MRAVIFDPGSPHLTHWVAQLCNVERSLKLRVVSDSLAGCGA